VATRRGQNVLEDEKITSSVSRKPSEIEPWLVVNVNISSKREQEIIVKVRFNAGLAGVGFAD